jgi:hypothetical protein
MLCCVLAKDATHLFKKPQSLWEICVDGSLSRSKDCPQARPVRHPLRRRILLRQRRRQYLRAKIPNIGAKIPNIRMNIPNIRMNIPNIGAKIPNIGTKIPNIRMNIPNIRAKIPNIGTKIPNIGAKILNLRANISNIRSNSWNLHTHFQEKLAIKIPHDNLQERG